MNQLYRITKIGNFELFMDKFKTSYFPFLYKISGSKSSFGGKCTKHANNFS